MQTTRRRVPTGAGAISLADVPQPLAALDRPATPPPPEVVHADSGADNAGMVFAFGWNGHGQLGTGDETERPAPRPLRMVGIRIALIAAGSSHSVAVDTEGTAWAWGANAHGQLGAGDFSDRCEPTRLDCEGQRISGIACGARHTVLCTARGRVIVCGSNASGQLGLSRAGAEEVLMACPMTLSTLTSSRITALAAGFSHSLFLTRPGLVLACGADNCGQLGLGDRGGAGGGGDMHSPTVLGELSSVPCAAIGAGNYHSCALARDDGGVYTWGEGRYGRLGHGTEGSEDVPRLVHGTTAVVKRTTSPDEPSMNSGAPSNGPMADRMLSLSCRPPHCQGPCYRVRWRVLSCYR